MSQKRVKRQRQSKRREALINNGGLIPYDIRTDIAKAVRSVDWVQSEGGACFARNMTGWMALDWLGIASIPVLGGLVYRAGPDPCRDLLLFCGPGYTGISVGGKLRGHYWLGAGEDFIDFSVGDWREISENPANYYHTTGPRPVIDPIQWTAPLPDFFWANKENFRVRGPGALPDIGEAWYTGFSGEEQTFYKQVVEIMPFLKQVRAELLAVCECYHLKDRLAALRNHQRLHTNGCNWRSLKSTNFFSSSIISDSLISRMTGSG